VALRPLADYAYFDNAATTPMHPEAVEAMLPFLASRFGNPSGGHALARDARRAVDEARDCMAEALGCHPGEVVFTGGGTESDNLALLGRLEAAPGVAVASAIEHHAVLHCVEHTGGRFVAVDGRGVVDLDALDAALDADVSVVSVMLANNEVGTIQPLDEIGERVRAGAPNAVLHTDAVQAFPWLDVARLATPAALVSVSAHKFGGPKGVGALVIRQGTPVHARLLGGGQERGMRSGTDNVAGIAAMAAAAAVTVERRKQVVDRVGRLRDRLASDVLIAVAGAYETVPRASRVAGNCHLCFDGVEGEALLFLLEQDGVVAAAGSSCSSGAQEPSHVLSAMGVPRERALGAVRLSLGPTTTEADVDRAVAVIRSAVARLRSGGS
jgi:cysteine desulfurase